MTNEEAAHEITKQILVENIPNLIGIAADALANSIIAALAEVELITEDSEDEDTIAEAYWRRGETGLGER